MSETHFEMLSSYHLGHKGLDSNTSFLCPVRVSRCMICAKKGHIYLFLLFFLSLSFLSFHILPSSLPLLCVILPPYSPVHVSLPLLLIYFSSLRWYFIRVSRKFCSSWWVTNHVLILSQYNHLLNIFYIPNLKYIHFCICHCVYIDVVIDVLYLIFSHLF